MIPVIDAHPHRLSDEVQACRAGLSPRSKTWWAATTISLTLWAALIVALVTHPLATIALIVGMAGLCTAAGFIRSIIRQKAERHGW